MTQPSPSPLLPTDEAWTRALGELCAALTGDRFASMAPFLMTPRPSTVLYDAWYLRDTLSSLCAERRARELRLLILPSLSREAWQHHQPHPHKTARCSAGVTFWAVSLRAMRHDALHGVAATNTATSKTTSATGLYGIGWLRRLKNCEYASVVASTARDLEHFYTTHVLMFCSRARVDQYRVDVLMVVLTCLCEARYAGIIPTAANAFMRPGAAGGDKGVAEQETGSHDEAIFAGTAMEIMAARMLGVLALFAAPASLVAPAVGTLCGPRGTDHQGSDASSAVLGAAKSILASFWRDCFPQGVAIGNQVLPGAALGSNKASPFNPTAEVGAAGLYGVRVADLRSIQLPWSDWLAHVGTLLTTQKATSIVSQRHDLGKWDYPPLDDDAAAQARALESALASTAVAVSS